MRDPAKAPNRHRLERRELEGARRDQPLEPANGHLIETVAVLGGDAMLHHQQEGHLRIDRRTGTAVLDQRVAAGPRAGAGGQVDRRAADVEHIPRVLTHRDDAARAELGRREVNMGQLSNRVPDTLIDRSGHLATLGVGDRNVHVGTGDGCRDRLEAVCDGDHDVGFQALERRRQFQQA